MGCCWPDLARDLEAAAFPLHHNRFQMVLDKNRLWTPRRNRSACVRDGSVVLSGVHTLTVQVASLISPTQQLQLVVPWRAGAGGQCWCDERGLPVHSPPAADCNQVPNPALPNHTLKGPTNRFLLVAAAYLSIGRLSQTLALLKPLSFCWTQPHPCTVPLSQPNMFKSILFSSSSSFLEPAQVAGEGAGPRAAAPLQVACGSAAILTPKTLISNGARYKDGKI